MGYKNVSNIGAIGDWKKNGVPMTKPWLGLTPFVNSFQYSLKKCSCADALWLIEEYIEMAPLG